MSTSTKIRRLAANPWETIDNDVVLVVGELVDDLDDLSSRAGKLKGTAQRVIRDTMRAQRAIPSTDPQHEVHNEAIDWCSGVEETASDLENSLDNAIAALSAQLELYYE